MLSREGRIRLYLGLLILVLVVANSQSLQVSYQSGEMLARTFEESARLRATALAAGLPAFDVGTAAGLTGELERLGEEANARSTCLIDWNGRVLAGVDCAVSASGAFDRLDPSGKRRLLEQGWAMTAPTSFDGAPVVFGYLALRGASGSDALLRLALPAAPLAEARRRFRTALLYQVSALSAVLLTLVFFVKSLFAPHRRLLDEARSVARRMDPPPGGDEASFLLATFQEVVSRLKEKEEELARLHQNEKARADETEALASDIIRSMTTGLVSVDASGRVVLVNPAAEKIFGLAGGSPMGTSFPEAFPGSPELALRVERALCSGELTLRRRIDYRARGGEIAHLGVNIIPLRASGDEVRGALCLVADLTEVIHLRERLFLEEHLARLGEMAAGIAHEFRNGLGTILGNAKLLEHSVSSEEAREALEALIQESRSLNRVTAEFLQFARPESLQLGDLDLGGLARDLAHELSERAREAGVELEVAAAACRVQGDAVLLRKAVSNLILNAIEALSLSGGRERKVRIETGRNDRHGFVRVADTGPGIPAEQHGRIFTPFFTTKPDGTGLGLALVQKIAVSHGGEVAVDSEEGAGSAFTLKIPLRTHGTRPSEAWL